MTFQLPVNGVHQMWTDCESLYQLRQCLHQIELIAFCQPDTFIRSYQSERIQ